MRLWIWWLSTLENSFFAEVKLVKNANIDNNKYSGYSFGFDR